MDKCLISHIHKEIFSEVPSVTTLDLSQNLLLEVEYSSFQNLKNLAKLNLKDNPLICDNQKITMLKINCFKKRITCQSKCTIADMMQKIQQYEEKTTTSTQPTYIPWNFETDEVTQTPCPIIPTTSKYQEECVLFLPLLIAFSAGIVIGMVNIGLCAVVINLARERNKQRTDHLLNEDLYEFDSLSTPIPHRRLI